MNQNPIFTITGRSGAARTGILQTAHGAVRTPVFMPVGTQGSVKSLDADDLASLGAEIILGNTYHLHLRPGDDLIARQGGLHRFMSWDRPILTDSGGFQVFSLSGLRKITPDGVAFASHIDGSRRFFSPEKVIEIQKNLGSDVAMVLDECPPPDAGRDYTEKSLALTTDWAARCRAAMPAGSSGQLLFGIVQGGFFADLRARSAAEICSLGFEGHAIGGLSVGEDRALTYEMLAATAPLLPEDKPRYLMGVGAPADLLEGVSQGVDMFDCVLATRNARNGTLYTFSGKINIKGAAYAEDPGPIDPECSCLTCRTYSRAYLRHLYMARELSSYRLNTIHNLAFFAELMRRTRAAIATGDLPALKRRVFELYPPEPPAAPRPGPDK